MARTGSTIFAAFAVLLIGSAAPSMAEAASAGQPAGATLSGAAATAASRATAAKTQPWNIAERPRYVPGGWQCSPGLVWRNAGSTDWLCVDADEALRVEQENEAAAENWISESEPACRSGLVRREAFRKDVVCVDPERRDAVRQMNAALYTVR